MNVLGIGETVIDRVQIEETLQTKQHVGGTVTAALVVLARLGVDCTFVTTIGKDRAGMTVRRALRKEGIRAIYRVAGRTKINTMVVVNRVTGERRKDRGAVEHQPIANIDPVLIQQADLIILDRHEPLAFQEVLRHKRPEAKLLIDPSTEVSDHTLAMMKHAECPIVPIETLAQLSSHNLLDALDALHAICSKPVVVTAGPLGSVLFSGDRIEVVPSMSVQAVDATGAGDVYRGAYAYGILQGWSERRAAEYANAVAATQCTRVGNLTAIPEKLTLVQLATEPRAVQAIRLRDISEHFQQLLPIKQPTTV